jgi:hypothetical protein
VQCSAYYLVKSAVDKNRDYLLLPRWRLRLRAIKIKTHGGKG